MNQTILIKTGQPTDSYRARVTQYHTGETLIVPVHEGSRGPRYGETLTTTRHGRLSRSNRNWRVTFDIPLSLPAECAATLLQDEAYEIARFIQHA